MPLPDGVPDARLVGFKGSLTGPDRARIRRAVQRAEEIGAFPPLPEMCPARWIVLGGWRGAPGPVTIRRLAADLSFTGLTAEEAVAQLDA